MTEIKIKYFEKHDELKLKKIECGDWIDLKANHVVVNGEKIKWDENNEVFYNKFDNVFIETGVAMQLPSGYEAHIAPRGSTFKKFGLIQVNHVGVVDESYCGDNDQWFIPMFCLKANNKIQRFDRVCQFRIMEKMDENITFVEVDKLVNEDRNGFGSTGYK
jgi:dUTP pyrophosphatase